MIEFTIPGRRAYRLAHLVLDLNGTLALDGQLIEGVAQRLQTLRCRLNPSVLTADTYGTVDRIEQQLGFPARRISGSADKARVVQELGAISVVAIGNGANDAEMLSKAILGIAVIAPEGTAREAIEAADVVAPNILSALDLLLNPTRLVATLRR
jgi:P-type E1-E2 ATPase